MFTSWYILLWFGAGAMIFDFSKRGYLSSNFLSEVCSVKKL